MQSVVITDQTVLSFFARHPDVDPNVMLVNVIDLYEYVQYSTSDREMMNAKIESLGAAVSKDVSTEVSRDIGVTVSRLGDKVCEKVCEKIEAELKTAGVTTNTTAIKHQVAGVQDQLGTVSSQLADLLGKFNNSTQKGRISENITLGILAQAFPSADIVDCTGVYHMCDFRVKRVGKPDILFENKDYHRNVSLDELKKFIEDARTNSCCAVLLSQRSGITNKTNWQIDIHDGNVLVYVHEVGYDKDKIVIAAQIVDRVYSLFQDSGVEPGVQLTTDFVSQLNSELRVFMKKRDDLVISVKNSYKDTLDRIKDLQLPEFHSFMTARFADSTRSTSTKSFACRLCDYTATTQQGINAHMKGCKKKSTT